MTSKLDHLRDDLLDVLISYGLASSDPDAFQRVRQELDAFLDDSVVEKLDKLLNLDCS